MGKSSYLRNTTNQYGGALILVLFLVLMMTTIGGLLLTTTTYSQKNLHKDRLTQEELYRAEGALDLVLDEMNTYRGGYEPLLYDDNTPVLDRDGSPLLIRKIGPYFYLEDGHSPSNKVIGGKEIRVKLVRNQISDNTYKLSLTAQYMANSTVERKLELEVTRMPKVPLPKNESGQGSFGNTPFYHINSFFYNGTEKNDKLGIFSNKNVMAESQYKQILEHLGYQSSINYHGTSNIYSSYNFPSGKHIAQQISLSGNNLTVHIPNSAKVFSQAINLSGGETVQLNIDGILVAESFNVSGSATVKVNGLLVVTNQLSFSGTGTLIINSGIITNHFTGNGNIKTDGTAAGINCTALGLTFCGESTEDEINPDNYPWTSYYNIESFTMSR